MNEDLKNAKIRLAGMLGEIKESFSQALLAFRKEAHKNSSPHPHRPDLRGSGMPRKRGKGQS